MKASNAIFAVGMLLPEALEWISDVGHFIELLVSAFKLQIV
jgi:hypothetical protein